jgi:glycosyltransferase involved in cell wall biosynthesis
VMPTFNRAYIISEAIQSIIDQTYSNWELFVCDDGSTDNTQAVIEQFADPRIEYLPLEKSNGAVARNAGLKLSQGRYIAYLDSDNIWHPQHLQICIQTLEDRPYLMSCYRYRVLPNKLRIPKPVLPSF